MEQEKHYRHEFKYAIPYADYAGLRVRLREVMDPERQGFYAALDKAQEMNGSGA